MAACFVLAAGVLVADPSPVASCGGYVLLDAAEFAGFQAVASSGDAAAITVLTAQVSSLQTAVSAGSATVTGMQSSVQTLLTAASANFDITYAMAAFSFFYCVVMIFWAAGKGSGVVLNAIRGRASWR